LQLTVLIGKPLTWTSNPSPEDDWCHQKLLQMRLQSYETKENQVLYYSHPTIASSVNSDSGPFAVKLVFPSKKTLVLACSVQETCSQIIGKAFATERKHVDLNKYLLRVHNRMEYLDNHTALSKFQYVSKQIKEGKEVELQVEEISNIGIASGSTDEELILANPDEDVEITVISFLMNRNKCFFSSKNWKEKNLNIKKKKIILKIFHSKFTRFSAFCEVSKVKV
jgi:hypothetical protein